MLWLKTTIKIRPSTRVDFCSYIYTLLQNRCRFSVVLFTCKLALVASFKGKHSFEFRV